MHPLVLVVVSLLIPFFCLGLLLWLSWLEDTLPEDVKRTERRNLPQRVAAMPDRSPQIAEPVPTAVLPEVPVAEPEPAAGHGVTKDIPPSPDPSAVPAAS